MMDIIEINNIAPLIQVKQRILPDQKIIIGKEIYFIERINKRGKTREKISFSPQAISPLQQG